jgi:hypothetical protein
MRDRRSWWVLGPGIAVGVVARFWNLPGQVLSGDELHAPQSALSSSLGEILTTYQPADNCLPLTALFKLWLLAGGRLSEAALRTPTLLASIAVLVVLPWLALRALRESGRASGNGSAERLAGWFALLLAVSPALVLYGRVARPYAPATLLAWIGILGLVLWRSQPARARWAIGAGVASGAAIWFHPLTLPLLAAAYGFMAVDLTVRLRRSPRDLTTALATLLAPAAVTLGVTVGPALPSLVGLVGAKMKAGARFEPATLGAWLYMAGAPSALRALPFALLACLGLGCLWRASRPLAELTVVVLLGQFVGILLIHPIGLDVPLFFGRYLLFALPGVLLWIASALEAVTKPRAGTRETWMRSPRLLAGVGLLALLVACGPLLSAAYRRSNFVHHNDWLQIVNFAPRVPQDALPPLYRQLPDEAVLLEIPASTAWSNFLAVPHLQIWHGKPVLVAGLEPSAFDGPQLAMANWLPFDPEAWLASRATIAIIHRDPAAEERAAGTWRGRVETGGDAARERSAAAIEDLEGRWGAPSYADEKVVAFDLDRVRAQRSRR